MSTVTNLDDELLLLLDDDEELLLLLLLEDELELDDEDELDEDELDRPRSVRKVKCSGHVTQRRHTTDKMPQDVCPSHCARCSPQSC